MKILVVDDHEIVLGGMGLLLTAIDPEAVVRLAKSCDDAAAYAAEESFDLILLDLNLPGISGMEGLQRIKALYPACPVVMLSAAEDPALMKQAMDCGAIGFIPKSTSPKLLDGVFRLVAAGGRYVPPEMVASAQTAAAPSPSAPPGEPAGLEAVLTERQREVLKWLAQGKPNKAIARAMNISEGTVKLHVQGILRALNVANRSQAIAALARLGQPGAEAALPPCADKPQR